MNAVMYKNKSKESRLKSFHENCDAVEEISYRKPFTKTETSEFKEELSQVMIDLAKIEAEWAIEKEKHSDQIKPVQSRIKRLVEYLEAGEREVLEPCFKFIDREKVEVGYYNEAGELVRERPANHNEMQLTIKHQD